MKVTRVRATDDMTPQEIAEALASVPVLEHWIKSLKAEAFERLRAGEKIPGWKMGWGVKKRIWKTGIEAAVVKTLMTLGFDESDIYTKPELMSPPKLDDLLKLKKLYPPKKRGEPRPATVLDPFIEMSMPSPAIVHADEGEGPDVKNTEASEEFK